MDSLHSAASELLPQYDSEDKIQQDIKARKITDLMADILRKQLRSADEQKLGVAIYMEAIVKFLNMRAKDFSQGPRALPPYVPMGLKSKVFTAFTEDQ